MFEFKSKAQRSICKICGKDSIYISKTLGLCADCIKIKKESLDILKKAHENIRKRFNLPAQPPKNKGVKCNICANECSMGRGDVGYCGLRMNIDGKLESLVSPKKALLYTYLDPMPTNCCASWFCPGGTGAGYPSYAHKKGAEYGYYNLAAFFYACNFNCVYCQNASHKKIRTAPSMSIDEFTAKIDKNKNISCICYFGGSPKPQLPFALKASENALEIERDILRICWEWNGCGNKKLVERAAKLSLKSGGNVKFDLKCFDENLSFALSGVSNKAAYENFKMVAEFFDKRPDLPVLTATTLLVPGYVDEVEVSSIARFISELNDEIPYSLLIFHPDFMMMDMPITPKEQAFACFNAAKKYLKHVNIGNIHLLGM